MECHGFPEDTCAAMKQKVARLEALLGTRISGAKKVGAGGHNHTLDPDDENENVFLTLEQIDYFIKDVTNTRRRYRRKVDSFGQFVTKWSLPIQYTFDGTHNRGDRQKIKEAISHWQSQTCVRFKQVDTTSVDPSDPNRVLFMKYRGCGSYIGKVNISPQPVDLASRCLRHFGIIAHEIGHVIGFWHEHQRSDRDSYIQIKTNNAVLGLSFVSELMRLGRTSNLLPYDYGSVLHYSAKTMSANGDYTIETKDPLYQKTIGQRTGLSFLDAKLANMVYCSDSCPTPLPQTCQNEGYQDPNACQACRCPDGISGTYCDRVAPPVNAACGGVIRVFDVPQYMTSPDYFRGYYEDHVDCTWLLQTEVGSLIQFRFESDFGIYCIDGVCFHWVEVRYGDSVSNVGPRFCCGDLPQVTLQSTGNQMMVLFRSNYTTYGGYRRGFRASYWAVTTNARHGPLPPQRWYTNGPLAVPNTPITPVTTPLPTRRTAGRTPDTPPPPTARSSGRPTRLVPATWPTVVPGNRCTPLDIAIILDSSGSVGARNWPKVIEFAVSIARRLPVGYDDVRVGAVSFGTAASLHFTLLSYTSEAGVVSAIRSIRWKDQMTNTSGGIWLTRTALFTPAGGDRPWAPNVALLLTDGEANRDEHLTIPEADAAKQHGIVMKVIGVGNRLNRPKVEAIASSPLSDNLYFANDFDDLSNVERTIVNSMCALARAAPTQGPVPSFTTSGQHKSSSTGSTGGLVTTLIPATGCRAPGPADIAFVVDSSGSIGPVNWRKVLDFLQTFVSRLSITPVTHRVGVVMYGTSGQFEFGLDQYSDVDRLKNALDRLRWLDEMTNTSGGIRVMRTVLFDPRSGDRPNVPNIAVILTDGESNRDPHRVLPEAEAARAAGISMFVIGVGNKLNMEELEWIANTPTDQYLYRTRDFNDLNYVILNIINVMCGITSSTTGPRRTSPTTLPTKGPTPQKTPYPTSGSLPPTNPYTTRLPTTQPTQHPAQPTQHPTQPTQHPTQAPTTRHPITHRPTQLPMPTPASSSTQFPTRFPSPYPYPSRYPTNAGTPSGHPTYKTTFRKPVDCSTSRADVVFVLDSSGSVGRSNWPLMMNFTKAVMRVLPYGPNRNQYGVVTFGNEATVDVRLNSYPVQADMFAVLGRIRWKDEWTNTSGGLRVMREDVMDFRYGRRAGAVQIGLLVTDGESNRDRQRTLPEARAVHDAGITMFAVGVGPNVDVPELRAISSDPRSIYLQRVDDFRRLWRLASSVADAICAVSSTGGGRVSTFAPLSVSQTPRTPSSTRHTASPHTAPPSPQPGGVYRDCYPIDLCIAIDASRYVKGVNDWALLLRYVTEIVKSLPVSPNKVKVGVVAFAQTARLEIPLGLYPSTDQLVTAIHRLPWRNERTNTSGAILLMRSQALLGTDPARFGVPKVGLVITAGQSDLDAHLTIPEANVARQQGIEMFAVGVTSQVWRDEVTGIGNQPSSTHAFFADQFDTLHLTRDHLLRSICNKYDPGLGRRYTSSSTTSVTPAATTAEPDGWGAWTSCSRPCGGCGRMWRSKQCQDATGRLNDCGIPEEITCNAQPCTAKNVCTFYVAWRKYNRPCQPCCYGFNPDYTQNLCIAT